MKEQLAQSVRALSRIHPLVFTPFVLAVVGMNLLANKSVDTGLPFLVLDCGIVFSGLAFLCIDVIVHCYGLRTALATSVAALAFNLMMALFFFCASIVPGAWGESFVEVGGPAINQALDNTIGGTWYVTLGSSIAFLVSAVVDSLLNSRIGERVGDRGFGAFALRSYTSTIVAQFADNLTFALLVSRIFFGWTLVQCVGCAFMGALIELFFEVFFSPLGYRIAQQIRVQQEGQALALETE